MSLAYDIIPENIGAPIPAGTAIGDSRFALTSGTYQTIADALGDGFIADSVSYDQAIVLKDGGGTDFTIPAGATINYFTKQGWVVGLAAFSRSSYKDTYAFNVFDIADGTFRAIVQFIKTTGSGVPINNFQLAVSNPKSNLKMMFMNSIYKVNPLIFKDDLIVFENQAIAWNASGNRLCVFDAKNGEVLRNSADVTTYFSRRYMTLSKPTFYNDYAAVEVDGVFTVLNHINTGTNIYDMISYNGKIFCVCGQHQNMKFPCMGICDSDF